MPVPFTTDDAARLKETFESVVADGATPGGVLAYGTTGASPQYVGVGVIAPECGDEALTRYTAYDIASLLKVVATWPLVGQALTSGLLDLDEPILPTRPGRAHPSYSTWTSPSFLPAMSGEMPSAEVTVRQLFTHPRDSSGLHPTRPLPRRRPSAARTPGPRAAGRRPRNPPVHQPRPHPPRAGPRPCQ